MSSVHKPHPSSLPRRQQGISLLVVLILLVVMSILGVAVLRSSAMQERMSANMVDRNEAMQAAETGLLVAQRTVINGTFNAIVELTTLSNGTREPHPPASLVGPPRPGPPESRPPCSDVAIPPGR